MRLFIQWFLCVCFLCFFLGPCLGAGSPNFRVWGQKGFDPTFSGVKRPKRDDYGAEVAVLEKIGNLETIVNAKCNEK